MHIEESSVYSGEYPRLSRGRPGFDSPPGSEYFWRILQSRASVSAVFYSSSSLFQAIPLIFFKIINFIITKAT